VNVLIACEYSGRVREAFRARGHFAVSVDLLPSEDNSPFHYQCDVLEFIKNNQGRGIGDFDLMIAHPPCTDLAVSGVVTLRQRLLTVGSRKLLSSCLR
jgi:hypothetical protein